MISLMTSATLQTGRILAVISCLLLCSAFCAAQDFPGESFKGNEDDLARQMSVFIQEVVQARYPTGTMKRFNQAKSLGCFDGTFTINDDIPNALQHGIFASEGSFPATLRFASASTTDDEEKDLRGLSARLSDVPGDVVWGEPGLQDFVLNSHPVLFAATPEKFLAFIEAQRNNNVIWHLLTPTNWSSLFILLKARDNHTSPFDIRYWSTTPYKLGDKQAVKYSVTPCSEYQSSPPDKYTNNYLRAAMKAHLQYADVCFDFMVQPQTNNEDMPIEDATARWDEDASPFIRVARLVIKDQPFISARALKACEALAFNPWQSLSAHAPLGRMNYVRKEVYRALAGYRKRANEAPSP